MYYIRAGLGFSVIFVCCTYVRAFVLTESGARGDSDLSNDIENRIVFLATFLGKVNSITNAEDLQNDVPLQRKKETSLEQDFRGFDDVLRILEDAKSQELKVDKKDYAILPPASEWCRMMGFRRCRGNSS